MGSDPAKSSLILGDTGCLGWEWGGGGLLFKPLHKEFQRERFRGPGATENLTGEARTGR